MFNIDGKENEMTETIKTVETTEPAKSKEELANIEEQRQVLFQVIDKTIEKIISFMNIIDTEDERGINGHHPKAWPRVQEATKGDREWDAIDTAYVGHIFFNNESHKDQRDTDDWREAVWKAVFRGINREVLYSAFREIPDYKKCLFCTAMTFQSKIEDETLDDGKSWEAFKLIRASIPNNDPDLLDVKTAKELWEIKESKRLAAEKKKSDEEKVKTKKVTKKKTKKKATKKATKKKVTKKKTTKTDSK